MLNKIPAFILVSFLSLVQPGGHRQRHTRDQSATDPVTDLGAGWIQLPVQNPSFELEATPPSTDTIGDSICGVRGWQDYGGWYRIPGWQGTDLNGNRTNMLVFQPDVSSPPTFPCYNTPPPDGKIVALVQNGTISQDTGIKVTDLQTLANGADGDGVFVMKFFVANRFNAYPGYFEGKLGFGKTVQIYNVGSIPVIEQKLCSTDGWGTRNWKEVTLVCPAPSYLAWDGYFTNDGPGPTNKTTGPADLEAHVIISLTGEGWDLYFDKVSIAFRATP